MQVSADHAALLTVPEFFLNQNMNHQHRNKIANPFVKAEYFCLFIQHFFCSGPVLRQMLQIIPNKNWTESPFFVISLTMISSINIKLKTKNVPVCPTYICICTCISTYHHILAKIGFLLLEEREEFPIWRNKAQIFGAPSLLSEILMCRSLSLFSIMKNIV